MYDGHVDIAEGRNSTEFLARVPLVETGNDLMFVLNNAHTLTEDGGIPGRKIETQDDISGPAWSLWRAVSASWVLNGRPRYVLSSSVASLLVSTKAPAVSDETLTTPYSAFVVEVPGEWTSLKGVGPLVIMCARMRVQVEPDIYGTLIVACRKRTGEPTGVVYGSNEGEIIARFLVGEYWRENDRTSIWGPGSVSVEVCRYLVNTCCLVTAHQECAPRRTGRKNTSATFAIHDVSPPRHVSVTTDFRRYARQLVADRRVSERKEALLHIVRGHWKRQVKGAGRTERGLIWIHPYQRGIESLGRVVEKAIHVPLSTRNK